MLKFEDLDELTRRLMDEEYKIDKDKNKLYFSPRLSDKGKEIYDQLLENAIVSGDNYTLAKDIEIKSVIKEKEKRISPVGGTYMMDVPKEAGKIIADTDFNKYYIRAMCRKAIDKGINKLTIYKSDPNCIVPDEYQKFIGKHVDANELLKELRKQNPGEVTHGVPDATTGLTVKLSK